MFSPRIGICLAAACCALACGDRPDLPGPTTPSAPGGASNAGSSNGGNTDEVTVLEAEPRPAPVESTEPIPSPAPDASPPPVENDGVVQSSPDPVGPGLSVSACTVAETGCVRLYIAVADSEAESCLQLTLDDCNDTTRAGFDVDVPLSWRFGSGFVGKLGAECLPNTAFVATNTAIVSGTGSISWNEDTRQPSEIVIDVTLQPSNIAVDSDPIRLSNSDLVEPLVECDG
jgi:hypothetical protein